MKNTLYKTAAESFIGYNRKREKLHDKATRRQQKHDMLLTFMASQTTHKPRAATPAPSLLRSILSIFL
jgi:hypothetical protein